VSLIDDEDSSKITPLESACSVGNWSCAALLIEKGANVNHIHIGNQETFCPLGNVLSLMSVLDPYYVEDYEHNKYNIVRVLLERGADPNVKIGKNVGPRHLALLWVAVKTRSKWIVNMLLDHGALVGVHRTRYGGEMMWNILDYSLSKGYDNHIERILIERCNIKERKILIDVITLINAIKTTSEKKVEIILAYFIECYKDLDRESCGYIMSKIIQYGCRDNRFIYEFLILFPNAKNCIVKKKFEKEYSLVEFAKEFPYNSKIIDIIQNFDYTLFDLINLHLYYRELTNQN